MKVKQIKIRKETMRGTVCWTVEGRAVGKGRWSYRSEEEALKGLRKMMNEVYGDATGFKELTYNESLDARRAISMMEGTGKSVIDACAFYKAHLNGVEVACPLVKDVVGKIDKSDSKNWVVKGGWLEHKHLEKISRETLAGHDYRLQRFLEKAGEIRVRDIDHSFIHGWLHGLKVTAWTRIDYRKTLLEFFEWCLFPNSWINVNPVKRVELNADWREIGGREVPIFTINQSERVLGALAGLSDDGMRRYVIACLFAGLRPEAEAMRITRDCFLESGELKVLSNKTGETRYMRLEDGVRKALLTPDWQGLMIGSLSNWIARWSLFQEKAGFKTRDKNPNGDKWQQDVMRHTYASYHLAKWNNRSLLAELMGNSEQVIRSHYRRPIPREEGEKFWQLIQDYAATRLS